MTQMQKEMPHPNLPLNQDEIDLIVKIVSSDEKLEIPKQLLDKNIDRSLEQIKATLIQIDPSYDFEIKQKLHGENFCLIHLLSQLGKLQRIQDLSDDQLQKKTEFAYSPLLLSAKYGKKEVVEYIIFKFPNLINDSNVREFTALHLASYRGHVEIVGLLLERGASVCKSADGATALHLASEFGHVEIAKLLLEKGALVDQATTQGFTPLHTASQNGHIEIVRLLLGKGALVDHASKDETTALHLASYFGHVEIAKLLLEQGADLNQPSKDGATALHFASKFGHLEVVRLLLEQGVDVNQASKDGATALHFASCSGYVEVVSLLLEKGASVDQTSTDESRFTALHLAAELGYLEVVRLLLKKGADVDKATTEGCTPLHLASRDGHLEVVRLLLENGADMAIRGPANVHFYPFQDIYSNDEIMLKVSKLDVTNYIDSEAKFDRLIYIITNSQRLKEIKLGNLDWIDNNLRTKILEAFDKNKSLIKIYPTNLISSEICENLCERNKSMEKLKEQHQSQALEAKSGDENVGEGVSCEEAGIDSSESDIEPLGMDAASSGI